MHHDDLIPIDHEHGHATRHAMPDSTCSLICVGEDNPQSSALEHTLCDHPPNCAGHRLASKIFGLRSETYLAIWRSNLCCPTWNQKQAVERARALVPADGAAPWTTLVLLGAKVAKVFERLFLPKGTVIAPFSIREVEGFTVAALPHPSGRSQAWNNPDNLFLARGIMRALEPQIAWGEALHGGAS